MFFTRFPINKTRRDARKLLSSPYAMHAAISGSFPPQDVQSSSDQDVCSDDGRVLWRLDTQPDNSLLLYIVSPNRPSLVGLDEQLGWPDLGPQWATRSYDEFLSRIENGRRYNFRLVANPVVSRSAIRNAQGDSKRIQHLTALQQTAWLVGGEAYAGLEQDVPELFQGQKMSRAERNGFHVVNDARSREPLVTVSNMHTLSFKKGDRGNRITLAMAQYDGLLEVIDADALRHALTNGIGHGKGFGCGMLTLVPAQAQR